MDPACLRHTEIPGTSKLFADLSYHFDRVARFYRHNPHQRESYAAAAREIRYPDDRRAAMARVLEAQNPGNGLVKRFARAGNRGRAHRAASRFVFWTRVHDLQGSDGGAPGRGSERERNPGGADLLAGDRGSRFCGSRSCLDFRFGAAYRFSCASKLLRRGKASSGRRAGFRWSIHRLQNCATRWPDSRMARKSPRWLPTRTRPGVTMGAGFRALLAQTAGPDRNAGAGSAGSATAEGGRTVHGGGAGGCARSEEIAAGSQQGVGRGGVSCAGQRRREYFALLSVGE